MKKRLLSAALALAMVLTMLPLSVMPAFATTAPTNEGTSVYYHEQGKDFTSAASSSSGTAQSESGWYYWEVITTDGADKGKRTYTGPIDEGFVTSVSTSNGATATWYSAMGKELTISTNPEKKETPRPSTFTLLGAVEVEKLDWTISNGRLNGKVLTISALAEKTASGSNISSYSITVYGTGETGDKSELVLPSGKITGRTLNLTVTDAKVSGGIEVENEAKSDGSVADVKTWGSGTIKLTNCTLASDIDLPKGTVTLNKTTGTGKSITIGTCAASQGGTITLDNGSTVGSVALYGPSTLNVNDMSNGGTVTVFGGGKADVEANAKLTDETKMTSPNWGSKINLKTSGKITSVGAASASRNALSSSANSGVTNSDTSTHTISAETRANAGNITLDYANVTLTGAGAGTVAVKVGSVKLSGSATATSITLGDADLAGKCSLEIGEGATVSGDVKADDVAVSNLTVKVSGGKISKITLPDTYAGGGITGGSFTTPVEKPAWMSKVTYQIKKGGATTYQHTYTDSMDDAISAYTDTAGATTKNEVAIVGASANARTIKFLLDNETTTSAFELKADPGTLVRLPSKLGSRSVITWYNGSTPYPAGDYFQVVTGTGDITLNAISSDADIGTINSVTAEVKTSGAKNPYLAAEIVGNTIRLSGAVEMDGADSAPLELTFTTTTGKEMKINATFFSKDPKEVRFAPGGTDDLSVTGNDKEVSLKGSTILFTVDCTNLKRMESVTAIAPATTQEVTISGTNLGKSEQEALKNALKAITFAYNPSGSGKTPVSNALNQAVNRALAGYTESSIKSAITAGQREFAKDKFKTNSPTKAQLEDQTVLAYDDLQIQVYLDIRVTGVTNYGSGTNGSITLDITPKYHEVVSNGSDIFVNPTAKTLDSALLKSTDGEVEITIPAVDKWGITIFATGAQLYAHHGDYVYKVESNKFTNYHGFSSFTINTEAPKATVDVIVRNGKDAGTKATAGDRNDSWLYDSLAQAVDDVANGGTVFVASGYKKETTLAVSGSARQFTVDNTANAGTALTFTGANVTSNGKNDKYTVELTQDNFTNARVTLNTAGNGTATLDVTSAKPGSTVSGKFTPNSGYKAGTFTATASTPSGSKTVAVNVTANGTFNFTVPSDATSVSVTPSFVLDTGLPFGDVLASAWYFDGVKYCYDTTKGGYRLMQGMNDANTIFSPNTAFNRAQVVQILWNMKGRPDPVTTVNPFSDIRSNHYAYKAVLWAVENGYADGYGDGSGNRTGLFKPDQAVSRQEMAVFLWKAAGRPTNYRSVSLNGYSDGYRVADWAQDAVKWAVSLGILSGQNSVSLNGTIAPTTTAYRREVAVTVMQFDKLGGF